MPTLSTSGPAFLERLAEIKTDTRSLSTHSDHTTKERVRLDRNILLNDMLALICLEAFFGEHSLFNASHIAMPQSQLAFAELYRQSTSDRLKLLCGLNTIHRGSGKDAELSKILGSFRLKQAYQDAKHWSKWNSSDTLCCVSLWFGTDWTMPLQANC